MSYNKKEMESTNKLIKAPKQKKTYDCKACQYVTHNKTLYNRHLNTDKHQNNIKNAKLPTQEDLQKLEEKRNSILNKDIKDCDKCFTSNVSPYHLSNGKFCANKIKYAQDLIKKHNANMEYEELLQEFTLVNTIKAFAQAFKNKYDLEPVFYNKQPNGKTSSNGEPTGLGDKDDINENAVKNLPIKNTSPKKVPTKSTQSKNVKTVTPSCGPKKELKSSGSDDDDHISEEKFKNYTSTPVRSQRSHKK